MNSKLAQEWRASIKQFHQGEEKREKTLKTSRFLQRRSELSTMWKEQIHKSRVEKEQKKKMTSEKQIEVKNDLLLSELEAKLAIAVLEECVDKFAIIGARLPEVEPNFSFHGINERASKPRWTIRNEHVMYKDDGIIYNKLKLSQELTQLQTVLAILKNELKEEGSHTSLLLYNGIMDQLKFQEEELKKLDEEFSFHVGGIKASTRQMLESTEKELITLSNDKRSLDAMEDEIDYKTGSMKLYAKHYFKANVEQNLIKIELTENNLKMKLKDTIKGKKEEEKIHQQITNFLNRDIKKLEESLNYWNNAYKEDLDDKCAMVISTEIEINNQRHAMGNLLDEYIKREGEIINYLKMKAEKFRVEQLGKVRDDAATQIQAWWRGCMVRLGLGPYSSDQEKGRSKSDKKKTYSHKT